MAEEGHTAALAISARVIAGRMICATGKPKFAGREGFHALTSFGPISIDSTLTGPKVNYLDCPTAYTKWRL